MTTGTRSQAFDFRHRPETAQSFENALAKARNGERLSVEDGVALMTTGTDGTSGADGKNETNGDGIDPHRKELVLEAADRRRAEVVGETVTFVANLNNNVTTACNTGCLFCNFKDPAEAFRADFDGEHGGFTKTPAESRRIVRDAVAQGIYEVCSVSGFHPAFALDADHHEVLANHEQAHSTVNYRPPERYETDPGTYIEQIDAMATDGVHVHSMTPEEAAHARRGTDWSYERVYDDLQRAGLDSVPGTAAEILVDEVREVICPGKIDSQGWIDAIEGAASVGLDTTATIMYGHIENARHRVMHLKAIRDLQDRTGAITEFVPLSFVHENTPLYDRGLVTGGASTAEDELMIAVSRLFLDNIENVQSSWVKYGDAQGLKMLSCGANDFMGTICSEEITKRAGGTYGEYRSFDEFASMIEAIGRVPVERSTDYRQQRRIDPDDRPHGPRLGPMADGSPIRASGRARPADD